MSKLVLAMLIVVAGVVAAARIGGPSDLYDQDQPKTIAYTADIVLHGRWALPRDNVPIGDGTGESRPSTKPPMYNWIGAACVWATGRWDEWVLKMPSLLAALATLIIVFGAARKWAGGSAKSEVGSGKWEAEFAAAAVASWLTCYATLKLAYLARPDMVLTAFLVGGWWCASELLGCGEHPGATDSHAVRAGDGQTAEHERRCRPWRPIVLQLALWLCVAGAALTKGPSALMVIAFVVLGAPLIGGGWRSIGRTGWWWGLPLAVVLVGGWLSAVHQTDPTHIGRVFLGQEMAGRSGEGGFDLSRYLADPWKMLLYFLAMFAPWSVFAILGIVDMAMPRPRPRNGRRAQPPLPSRERDGVRVGSHDAPNPSDQPPHPASPPLGGEGQDEPRPRKWATLFLHPMGPAALWVIIVIAFGVIGVIAFDRQRADYLAPAYPAGAILAAYWLLIVGRKYGIRAVMVMAFALAIALGLAIYNLNINAAADSEFGPSIRQFVRDVKATAGDEPIAFIDTGYNPVQTLLGRHQTGRATAEELARAKWLIRPVTPNEAAAPAIQSGPIPEVIDGKPAVLGLYDTSPSHGPGG